MEIGIIGTGYVGLVTGTCFAEMGNTVTCVDIDESKVTRLQGGELPIFEPGLEVFFRRNLREERLHFTTELQQAIRRSDILFLALPTPPAEDGSADLSYVLGVADHIGELLAADPTIGYRIIVNKSTVPVGTAAKVQAILEGHGLIAEERFDVVSNPEFLREGVAVDDFMKPERVVIGSSSARAAEAMRRLYEPFVRQGNPILIMDEASAEMTKYAANAMLATKITFMNEVANVCERVGANVDQVRIGIGLDSRIGKRFLYPGIGFGGSCFPKDVSALARTASEQGYRFEILESVLAVNARQRAVLAERVIARFAEGKGQAGLPLAGRRVGIWGLAFKPNTDDVREAPAHAVIGRLLEAGAEVMAFDPEAMETTRAVLGERVAYMADAYSALKGVDCLVICTEWAEFRRPDFVRMYRLLREKTDEAVVFDGRNLYDPWRMAEAGFEYHSIGRPQVVAAPAGDGAVQEAALDV